MKWLQKNKIWLTAFALSTLIIAISSSDSPPVTAFHTQQELDAFRQLQTPIDSGEYFLGSSNCKGCHGFDSLHIANIDASGNDINLHDDWQSSMMALAAIDPLWRAKVSHEILVNPNHATALQTKCTSCHAPMGNFTAKFKGHATYTLADLLNDTLGLNGVSCSGCHTIAKDSAGSAGIEFSGNLHFDTSRVEYGPFDNPLTGPMELYVGFIPTHSEHMSRSGVCAPCHSLQTSTVDLNGNFTGGYFVEQATYHEWLNSNFNSEQPCQSCHMPQIQDPVIIANNIQNLPPRSPFNLHKFMGGNSFMLNLIKQNKNALGVDVPDKDFDSTITATLHLLQTASVDMSLQIDSATADTLFVSIELKNKAGHKFPSGYPSRRAFVSLAVTSGSDTVFQSGMVRPDYEVTGQGAAMMPHYNVISNQAQVQIYEMVMGDVNNNITTILERAAAPLKDNRIPPEGFTTNHYAYDTAQIVGVNNDPDFNLTNNIQGSGKDVIHYHIPLNHAGGTLHISSAMYYQVLPPRFVTDMFSHSSSFIDSFKTMYQTADKQPVLIAHAQADTSVISSINNALELPVVLKVFPVPSVNGRITLQSTAGIFIHHVEVWNSAGKKTYEFTFSHKPVAAEVSLPAATGVYFLRIETNRGVVVKKVIRQ